MTSYSELGLSLAAGSLTTLSPCVFPLLPVVVGGALQGHRAAPLAMGVGMASSFALIGLLVGTLGDAGLRARAGRQRRRGRARRAHPGLVRPRGGAAAGAAAYASRAGFGRVRGWVINHSDLVKQVFGIGMLALGLAILTGFDRQIETRCNDWLPPSWLFWSTRY